MKPNYATCFSFSFLLASSPLVADHEFDSKGRDQTETLLQASKVAQAINIYYQHNRGLPEQLDDLVLDTGDTSWRGPYAMKEFLYDNWKTRFKYERDDLEFKLTSAGVSKEFGDTDDIIYKGEIRNRLNAIN